MADADTVQPTVPGFITVRTALRPSGGLARCDDLARLLEDSQRGDFITLARLIARGEVSCFPWRGSLWAPMFQFDLFDLALRPAPLQVRRALPTALDGWGVATWFTRPNGWLDGSLPVSLLDVDLPRLLQAAHAEPAAPSAAPMFANAPTAPGLRP